MRPTDIALTAGSLGLAIELVGIFIDSEATVWAGAGVAVLGMALAVSRWAAARQYND